jgi:hypothetical protein
MCETGEPLGDDCDPCIASICAADPFCCTSSWDAICVGEVESVCGLTCPGGGTCGDGACDAAAEDCATCPADCGTCPPATCGDGACTPGGGTVSGTGSNSYMATMTANATVGYTSQTVTLSAGDVIDLSTCDVTGGSASGDTYLRLYRGATEVAANDDSCSGLASRITYTATVTDTYEIREGCFASTSCGGTVAWTITSGAENCGSCPGDCGMCPGP